MGAFTTVLCATDLSEGGDEAIRAAGREAKLHGATLAIVHVLPNLGAAMSPEGVERTMVQRETVAAELGDQLLERVARLTGASPDDVAVHLEDGPPDVAILRAAAELRAGLIVVGSAGTSGVRRLFLGSSATKVLRAAPVSVMVARPQREGGAVLFAADFTGGSEVAGRVALEEAQLRRAKLIVVHSVQVLSPELELGSAGVMPELAFGTYSMEEMQRAAHERLVAMVEKLRLAASGTGAAQGAAQAAVQVQVEAGPPAPVIVAVAEKTAADVIVLGTARRRGVDRLLLGSVAEDLVRDAACSVLAVRRADR